MNRKGFTLVELLAVMVILGIMAIIGLVAYQQHLEASKKKGYDMLASSAADAAAEYNIDHFGTETVTLKELVEKQYLENVTDPAYKEKKCRGWVDITHTVNYDGLETEKYNVTICCSQYEAIYHFPGGTKGPVTCTEE